MYSVMCNKKLTFYTKTCYKESICYEQENIYAGWLLYKLCCPRGATLNPQDCVYLLSRPTVSADACQNTADNFMGVGTTLLVTETSHNVCVCYLIWIANGCACLPQRGAHALTLPQHYVFQELRQLLFCKGNSNEFVINVQITCQGRYRVISWYQCTITWGNIKGAPIFQ